MAPEQFQSHVEEEALRRRSAVFDHLPDGVMVTTLEGVIIDWNRGAEQMFGWSREEVLGRTPAILHRPEDAAELTDRINATATRDGRWSGEITFLRKDGSVGVCETTTTPMRDEQGRIIATLGVNHDITARKQTEGRVIEERDLLRTLIDALPDVIFFKDRQGKYLLHNAANRRLYKLPGEEITGKTVFDLPGGEELARMYHADDMTVIETGEPLLNREEPFEDVDGARGCFLTSKFPLRDGAGNVIGLVGIARNITERKEAERKLADEQERLRTVIDAIPDLLFVKDLEGRHVLHNKANVLTFQFENPSATVYELPIPREYADSYAADDRYVMETGEPIVNREEPYQQKNGERGWFLTSKFPLRDSSGEITGLVGICRDITDIRRSAAELEQARQRLIDHVENSPMAAVEWTESAAISRWSTRARVMFGWAEHEVLGRSFLEIGFVHPEDDAQVREIVARLLDGRDQRSSSRNRNLRKDGTIVHCSWQNSVLRDAEGRIVSVLSLVQDVTEQVAAEETIRENERLYHTMVEATNTGYVQLDQHGIVLEANAEYVRLTGRTDVHELLGAPCTQWAALHDFDRTQRALHTCIDGGSVRNFELEYVTPEGAFVAVEMNACSVHVAQERRIIAFCRDISERRNAERERKQMERNLQEAQKLESLGVLAGGIAHDFNNLLTGVLGNASLASTDLGPGSPVQPYLEQIETAALRAADLCKQMLAYSGKGRFFIQRLDLNNLITETAELLQISVSKKASLSLKLAASLPAVLADATQLRQVVMNLVINASEALGDRAGSIYVATGAVQVDSSFLEETHLSPDLPAGEYVFLDVMDDGVGMSQEVQRRIFDPFFTTKFTGRGLGLAAVLGIVRGHKGALKVYSEEGVGTTFKVLLPATNGPGDELGRGNPASSNWRGEGTVLVIDDEESVRVTTSRMLQALGFSPLQAENGREGLKLFGANRGAIVLTVVDLTMPEMDGEEVFRELRLLDPEARVLLMSGFNEQEATSRFSGKPLDGFLQKPFRVPALREKLQQILGG
jgi:PAS domain S-box-containing protein